ncbi:sugar ABC transporter substrate-binding protein [Actinomycetota bacterium]
MKKFLVWVLAVILAIALIVLGISCKGGAAETEEQQTYKIGHLIYQESFPASQLQLAGYKRVAEEMGNIELVTADINADWSKVGEQIDYLLLQEIDGLADASWGAEPGAVTVEKCKEAGIPIAVSDVVYEGDYEFNYTIGADNYVAGQVNGEAIVKFINEEWGGEYDYICGLWPVGAGDVVKGRITGAIDKMVELGIDVPDDKVLLFDTEGALEPTKNKIMDFLTGHPDSEKIILIINTDGFIAAGLSAVETMGREADVAYFSYDGDPNALKVLDENPEGHFFKGTVTFSLDHYADIGLPTIITAIEDPEAARKIPKFQSPELFHVNKANLSDFQ